ncbi:MAG TPA: hydroxymethylglutaryl-CoA lyase [Planctomycetota bacterium]|nr:hydroxymethylglutaryl-CoA lyase [Planctomycetota bacterium]
MAESVTVVETPRDAFQGLKKIIPAEQKIAYIRGLLAAGFRHVDLGSFVSPKAVPQMADSEEVVRAFHDIKGIERIAIIANTTGLERAIAVGGLDALGFPFSLSQQFQLLNTKTTTTQTWPVVEQMIAKTEAHDMSFILYLSMAFGNPYGEAWSGDDLSRMIKRLSSMGVRHISLADTVAVAKPKQVEELFRALTAEFPEVKFSAHFHGRPQDWFECVDAALSAGCRRFDAAAGGLGGCPFAQDTMIANTPSEQLVARLHGKGFITGVDEGRAKECAAQAGRFQREYA